MSVSYNSLYSRRLIACERLNSGVTPKAKHNKPRLRVHNSVTALAISASLLFSSEAQAKQIQGNSSEQTSGIDDRTKILLQRLGSKVLKMSRDKTGKYDIKNRSAGEGYRSISIIRTSPAPKGVEGKGTYSFTATFKGATDKPKANKVIQVAASQDAGPGGAMTTLDLRKCTTGYRFTGEYAGADGPSSFAYGYTQPQESEHELSTSELKVISSNYDFVFKRGAQGAKITRAFLPPFPAQPDPSSEPRC